MSKELTQEVLVMIEQLDDFIYYCFCPWIGGFKAWYGEIFTTGYNSPEFFWSALDWRDYD